MKNIKKDSKREKYRKSIMISQSSLCLMKPYRPNYKRLSSHQQKPKNDVLIEKFII